MILALSVLFLARSPPPWLRGGRVPPCRPWLCTPPAVSSGQASSAYARPAAEPPAGGVYLAAGVAAAAVIGACVVLVLLACGLVELLINRQPWRGRQSPHGRGVAAEQRGPRRRLSFGDRA